MLDRTRVVFDSFPSRSRLAFIRMITSHHDHIDFYLYPCFSLSLAFDTNKHKTTSFVSMIGGGKKKKNETIDVYIVAYRSVGDNSTNHCIVFILGDMKNEID